MDVFGRTDQVLAGGLSADSLFMTWPDLTAVGGGLGLYIQQVGLQYRQNIRRIFEIGPGIIPSGNGGLISGDVCDTPLVTTPLVGALCAFRTQPTYYIVSRPEGQMNIARIVGPNALAACFYKKYGSPCAPNVISLSGKAGCSATDQSAVRMEWTVKGVTLTDIGLNVTGQEMVMQESIGAMFTSLVIKINGDDGSGCNFSTSTSLTG